VDAAGENPQWPEPFPWVAGTSGDWTSRKLLERTEAMHRGAADRLRGRRHAQTVIVDVTTDPGFAPHRAIAAASGFRAVISTPVIDADGRLIGMVSAHYRQPHYPRARDRQIMQRYGELVGRAMAGHGIAAPDGRAGGRRSAAVKAFGSAGTRTPQCRRGACEVGPHPCGRSG
jgi:GAF domain